MISCTLFFRPSRAVVIVRKNSNYTSLAPLKTSKLKAGFKRLFGQLDAPHSQNFEIWNP
jgi:hypothetical protein